MSGERGEREGFLSRWSRLKTAPAAVEPATAPPAAAGKLPAPPQGSADAESPQLPPVEELTIESDFRGFFHPKVDEGVRRAALKKLFADPHFNIMDGLDVYIDDYSKADPIPPEMLAGLLQAKRIFRWAEGKDDEDEHEHAEALPESADAAPAQLASAEADDPLTTSPAAASADPSAVSRADHSD
jgi:hypothetical protein